MSRNRIAFLALFLLPALGACDLFTGPEDRPEPLRELPRALTAGEREVVAGSNVFAFGLLREVGQEDGSGNIFLSPLSASMALGMAMNGAVDGTLAGMRGALGFGNTPLAEVDASYHSLIELLRGLDKGVDFRLANSVWSRTGFPFKQSFYDTVREYFDAEVKELDFDAPQAAPTINDWVKRATGGKIESIVDPPIPAEMVMYLINAVYFKGFWTDRFEADQTRDEPFNKADGGQLTVRMMRRTGDMTYFEAPGVRGVELPYGRGAFLLTVVVPDAGTLNAVVASLDTARWGQWLRAGHSARVSLGLPKFRLTNDRTLNQPLIDLGMALAFTPDEADFSAMSPAGKQLYISKVRQKTYVDVNEEGTEAAAVTSVGVGVTSAPQTVMLTVDRPFLVAIRERFSGTILFLGAIRAPTSN